MMVAVAQSTAWFYGCTFFDFMFVFTAVTTLLLVITTLRGAVPILIALVALCDEQMRKVAFGGVALVVDIEAEFDACVSSLCVFCENDNGMIQR